ncbi:hypothetical protein J3E69DRAFT_329462 [Trichoderma sp. SZMC 28015]
MDINSTSTGTATTKQQRVPDKGPNIAAVLLSARTASYKYMFPVVIPGPRHATPASYLLWGHQRNRTDRTDKEKKNE